jgi:UTP-glucose-1-phosphate uridylyltransferase
MPTNRVIVLSYRPGSNPGAAAPASPASPASATTTGGAASAFTGIGRYVFTSEAFAVMDDVERALKPGAELDDIPVMQRLLDAGRLVGRRIRGRFLDVGLPDGHAEANAVLR